MPSKDSLLPSSPISIDQAVQSASAELTAFLQTLVRTPSLPDHEGAAQKLVADKFRALGLEVEIVPTLFSELRDHPAFGDDGFSPDGRVNVIGCWRGTGSAPGHSLILNGHVDVVPPGDMALWSDSPWSGLVREGRLYGRGACDMKAGLCAAIFAVDVLQRTGFKPAADVLIESVTGEESGGVGTLATLLKGYTAEAAILLEPTCLDICPVQSGALTFRLTVPGRSAHAAMKPEGVSAVEKFALLLQAINALEKERCLAFQHPLYSPGQNIAPISIGTVRAGEWHSTVPDELIAEGRLGVLPGETVDAARRALQTALERASAEDHWLASHPPRLEWFEGQFESAETVSSHPLIASLGAAHRLVTGEAALLRGVTYGSDMRLFVNHAGIPSTHYGPGDVRLAHSANESVPLAEVLTATRVIAHMLTQWCAAGS